MTLEFSETIRTLQAQLAAWQNGIASEQHFWNQWMQKQGLEWPDDFTRRLDAAAPFDDWVAPVVRSLGQSEVSVLDVGAGPITILGYILTGVKLVLTATDPLTPIYNDLIDRYGLNPPLRTIFAPAEELSAFFGPNSFDIVHCRNALDHSFDPVRGIVEMLKVVRVGGWILLRHFENEAERGNYEGFHQYNFDCRDGRFVIWNKSIQIDVAKSLPPQCEVLVEKSGTVIVRIRKTGEIPISDPLFRYRLADYLEAFVRVAGGTTYK